MSRTSIFILSFLTYATVHMMRTTYSFNKHTFQKIFGIGDLFLGFLDSMIYLTLAIGTFLRYSFLDPQKPTRSCLITAIPASIGFCIIPIIALFKGQAVESDAPAFTYILMIVCFGCFGFFQLNFFPATLTVFSNSFNVKNDGRLVGIWSSKSNAGNIMGFLMANLFVYSFNIKWEYTMILCSVMLVVICAAFYKAVQNPNFNNQPVIKNAQFFKYFKEKWGNLQFRLYILSFSFFKAVLYSYELWTPKFLADNGFKDFSGYVPMIFDVSTLFGSVLMGHIYKKQSNSVGIASKKMEMLNRYKFFAPSILIIIVCFLYLSSWQSRCILYLWCNHGSVLGSDIQQS